MSQSDLAGTWVGEGIETTLDIKNVIEIKPYKLVFKFERINNNCFKYTQTYFLLNGTLNEGPIDNLVDTNGKNEFIFGDSFGIGIDEITFDPENMVYTYNINGATPDSTQPYVCLNGVYNLKKQA